MRFSQRVGKSPIRAEIQIDLMDNRLRNRLFNVLKWYIDEISFWESGHYIRNQFVLGYCDYFGERYVDNNYEDFIDKVTTKIFADEDTFYFYDFIEFIVLRDDSKRGDLVNEFNHILDEEKAAYRFSLDGELIKITDEIELDEINRAIKATGKYSGVDEHLEKARRFFSNREKPDYKKSIEESVHAIEAIAKIVVKDKDATLSNAVKKISNLHPALRESIEKLYGFAGDADGIRHGNKNLSASEGEKKELSLMKHDLYL